MAGGGGEDEGLTLRAGSLQSRTCLLEVFRILGSGICCNGAVVVCASFFCLSGVVVVVNCLAATRGTYGAEGSVEHSSLISFLDFRCMIDLLRSGNSLTMGPLKMCILFGRCFPEIDCFSGPAVLISLCAVDVWTGAVAVFDLVCTEFLLAFSWLSS